jgi:hypothetical protein
MERQICSHEEISGDGYMYGSQGRRDYVITRDRVKK